MLNLVLSAPCKSLQLRKPASSARLRRRLLSPTSFNRDSMFPMESRPVASCWPSERQRPQLHLPPLTSAHSQPFASRPLPISSAVPLANKIKELINCLHNSLFCRLSDFQKHLLTALFLCLSSSKKIVGLHAFTCLLAVV